MWIPGKFLTEHLITKNSMRHTTRTKSKTSDRLLKTVSQYPSCYRMYGILTENIASSRTRWYWQLVIYCQAWAPPPTLTTLLPSTLTCTRCSLLDLDMTGNWRRVVFYCVFFVFFYNLIPVIDKEISGRTIRLFDVRNIKY